METNSSMLPLGTKAPDFNLLDVVTDKKISLQSIVSPKATVIMFICNHCPFVKHIEKKLLEIILDYQNKQIAFVAISANDVITYPQDGPLPMKEHALANHFTFPYLYDETQEVAKAYQAACTPDFFVFDGQLQCVYRGRFDASNPINKQPITGKDLCDALDCIIKGKPVNPNQSPSLGCNIKWKK